jgi:hypothetical protein
LDGATAYWIDPATLDPNTGKGALIGPPVTVNSGSTTLDIPPFSSDIVLRVTKSPDLGPVPALELDLASSVPVNPWRSDKRIGEPFVTFGRLSAGNAIKPLTVSGRWVKTLSPTDTSVTWDLTDDGGGKVASGLDVYLIRTGDGQKLNGQAAVVR